MLIVREIVPCTPAAIEIDKYVPFNIEFCEKSILPPFYFRYHDGDRSLLEIGISEFEKTICSITLTSINPHNVRNVKDYNISYNEIIDGLVVFETDQWKSAKTNTFASRFIDINVSLQLIISHSAVHLMIEHNDKPIRYIKCENVVFGLSENGALVYISLINLNQKQINLLKLSCDLM